MRRAKREKIPRKLANRITRISGYSLVLVGMTFLGLYGGVQLDRLTGMSPNFTFVCLITGIALGFKGFIQEVILERKGHRT
jgi:F0F1-type ATP synthase assembly protein I